MSNEQISSRYNIFKNFILLVVIISVISTAENIFVAYGQGQISPKIYAWDDLNQQGNMISNGGSTTSSKMSFHIQITEHDPNAYSTGVSCSLDGGPWTECQSGINYPDLPPQNHILTVKVPYKFGSTQREPLIDTFTWTQQSSTGASTLGGQVRCGAGTMLSQTGECIPQSHSEIRCGAGTMLSQTGECIPEWTQQSSTGASTLGGQVRCGAGTMLSQTGECIPEEPLVTPGPTEFPPKPEPLELPPELPNIQYEPGLCFQNEPCPFK